MPFVTADTNSSSESESTTDENEGTESTSEKTRPEDLSHEEKGIENELLDSHLISDKENEITKDKDEFICGTSESEIVGNESEDTTEAESEEAEKKLSNVESDNGKDSNFIIFSEYPAFCQSKEPLLILIILRKPY